MGCVYKKRMQFYEQLTVIGRPPLWGLQTLVGLVEEMNYDIVGFYYRLSSFFGFNDMIK